MWVVLYYLTDSYDSSQLALNTQSVLAMRLMGRVRRPCTMMDLPLGVCRKAFVNHVNKILTASNDAVRADQLASSEELHAMSADGTLFVPPPVLEGDVDEGSRSASESDQSSVSLGDFNEEGSDDSDEYESYSVSDADSDTDGSDGGAAVWTTDPLDVTVTFDGTWSKRGFTALYGVVVIASWDTGRMLDAYVMSKHCGRCIRKICSISCDGDVDVSSEFLEWYEHHKSEFTLTIREHLWRQREH